MKFEPKKMDEVAVLYDGKWGRGMKGEVLKRRGFAILVKFDEWGGDTKGIKQWFIRTGPNTFGAYVKLENSLMKNWLGLPGDWYSVINCNDYKKHGYKYCD